MATKFDNLTQIQSMNESFDFCRCVNVHIVDSDLIKVFQVIGTIFFLQYNGNNSSCSVLVVAMKTKLEFFLAESTALKVFTAHKDYSPA